MTGPVLVDAARPGLLDELGDLWLEQLMLFARGGEGLEAFYTAHGWREVGRWSGGLRVAGERRDDVWFARDV